MFSFFNCCRKKPKNAIKNDIKPAVHVLMPVYNTSELVLQSIQSVMNQDYPNLRLYIYDGGSTDSSLRRIQQYMQLVNHVKNKIHIKSAEAHRSIHQTRMDLWDWSHSENPQAFNLWLDSTDRYTDREFISNVMLAEPRDTLLQFTQKNA